MKLNDLQGLKKYRFFIDMDGVLADFEQGVVDMFGKRIEDYPVKQDFWDEMTKAMEEGMTFYFDLPEMSDFKQLWEFLSTLDNVCILSSTGEKKHHAKVGTQKTQWIRKHVDPNIEVNLVQKSEKKAEYVQNGEYDVLLDDRSKSIDPWNAAGGTGILHTSAHESIAQIQKLLK